MGKAKLEKRSKIKPFLKVVNFNHIMPTRFVLEIMRLIINTTTVRVAKLMWKFERVCFPIPTNTTEKLNTLNIFYADTPLTSTWRSWLTNQLLMPKLVVLMPRNKWRRFSRRSIRVNQLRLTEKRRVSHISSTNLDSKLRFTGFYFLLLITNTAHSEKSAYFCYHLN